MGTKPSNNFQSDRPESGGADHDEARENSGLLDKAKQQLAVAEQGILSAKAGLGGNPDIETDKHPSVMAALAARDKAAYDLAQTTVRAPATPSEAVTPMAPTALARSLSACARAAPASGSCRPNSRRRKRSACSVRHRHSQATAEAKQTGAGTAVRRTRPSGCSYRVVPLTTRPAPRRPGVVARSRRSPSGGHPGERRPPAGSLTRGYRPGAAGSSPKTAAAPWPRWAGSW